MKKNKLKNTAQPLKPNGKIPSDVLGSYTGAPDDGVVPVQDADDL